MANIDFNGLLDLFMEIFVYIQRVLTALESKFGFETWFEEEQKNNSATSSEG
ncbi:MAG: hypothetical protein IKJ63_10670 [Clostridia bacterium]|nr:hypothetical protein [Clostridia bacterium]